MAAMVPARRRVLALAWAVCAAGLTACDKLGAPTAAASFRGIDITGAPYGRGFQLLDADGKQRTLTDFRGQHVLLYFGFVQCPDVCPTALTRAVETRRLLGARGEQLQVVFITVDPERDTPEVLKSYVAAFDPSFVALRPTPEQLKTTAAEFKAYYKAVPTGSSYTMDHSALSYIFDVEGRIRLALRHEQTAQDYAHDIGLLLAQAAP